MLILLTGGSACGKSSFAESLCQKLPAPRVYLAAMKPYGEAGRDKIEKHRRMRAGKGFRTIERYSDYVNLFLPSCQTVLLECICNLTANEMFDECGREKDPVEAGLRGIENLRAQCADLIVVTNEIGSDMEAYSESTKRYIAAIGKINRALAQKADAVYELVCGIPVLLKGKALEVAI